MQKTSRNEKCPCGSGLKYKKCCMFKNEQKKAIHGAPAGVLYGPLTAGPDDDFYNRFMFQNLEIRSFVIPREKRLEFDADYISLLQNLTEAKFAKEFCSKYIQEHKQAIKERRDGLITGHQLNINNPIDIELNMFFKDFFIRSTMATEGLLRLLSKWFDYNLSFLFTDDEKKFAKGAKAFKLNQEDPRFQNLVAFINSHRDGWYRDFKDLRDDIQHNGYKLPQIKHTVTTNSEVFALIPLYKNQDIETLLDVGWVNLSTLCEEILVFIMSLELKNDYVVWRIPEDKRKDHNWARYKIAHPDYPEAHISCS